MPKDLSVLKSGDWVTVAEAAAKSGYSKSMVQHLLKAKRIVGVKIGRDWLTTVKAVKDFKRAARRGRPYKTAE